MREVFPQLVQIIRRGEHPSILAFYSFIAPNVFYWMQLEPDRMLDLIRVLKAHVIDSMLSTNSKLRKRMKDALYQE